MRLAYCCQIEVLDALCGVVVVRIVLAMLWALFLRRLKLGFSLSASAAAMRKK